MKKLILTLFVLFSFVANSQKADTLIVHYYENFPYAYTEAGKLKGIEIEIMEAYVSWSKSHGMPLVVSYKPFKEFSAFYNSVKDGGANVVGLGSVTSNKEREQEVTFSAPYLQNVAVLITDGKVPTIKTRSADEVYKTLNGLNAITVNKSSHAMYLNGIKKEYMPNLKIEMTESQNQVLEKITGNPGYFGYVDIVAYWAYLKKNSSKFLKIQKVFNEPKEYLSFITPKKSDRINSINEFFESGFGFTSTKAYHQILEKYLGYEIIESVEIK
jgi:putative glutamine transport system substrate-binding protein